MHRFTLSLALTIVVLLGLAPGGLSTKAQEATPAGTLIAPGAKVSVNGADIYYEVYGNGDPVILVHGALQTGLAFATQIPALVDAGYQVIVIDSRGQGRSTHGPEPITFELLASDVLGVMDQLGIDEADIVGWSNGAVVGLELGIHHPERLNKVVAYGAQFTPGMFVAATPDPEFDRFIGAFFETIAADYQRLSPEPEAWEDRLAEFSVLQPNYSEDDLKSISVPFLILDGVDEEVVPHDQPVRMAELIAGSKLVLMPGVGHFAPIQQPAEFNRIVLEFLAS